MSARIQSAAAILPSRDLERTVKFYKRLGFTTLHRQADQYAILARDGGELHFFPHSTLDPLDNDAGCYLRVADIDSLHREFTAAGIDRLGLVEETPWGMRECVVIDPDANQLRFGQPSPNLPPPPSD